MMNTESEVRRVASRINNLIHPQTADLAAAKRKLADYILRTDIIKTTVVRLFSKSQEADVVDYRIMLARKLYKNGWGLSEIGRFFNRDHAVIYYHLCHFDDRMLYDRRFRDTFESLPELSIRPPRYKRAHYPSIKTYIYKKRNAK